MTGTNGANAAKCLAHEPVEGSAATNATCPSGTAANFTYNYAVLATGTLASLHIQGDTAQGGSAGSNIVTISVLKNGTSALSCTITGSATSCEAGGSVSIASGDFLQVSVKETTGNGADGKWKTYVVIN